MQSPRTSRIFLNCEYAGFPVPFSIYFKLRREIPAMDANFSCESLRNFRRFSIILPISIILSINKVLFYTLIYNILDNNDIVKPRGNLLPIIIIIMLLKNRAIEYLRYRRLDFLAKMGVVSIGILGSFAAGLTSSVPIYNGELV